MGDPERARGRHQGLASVSGLAAALRGLPGRTPADQSGARAAGQEWRVGPRRPLNRTAGDSDYDAIMPDVTGPAREPLRWRWAAPHCSAPDARTPGVAHGRRWRPRRRPGRARAGGPVPDDRHRGTPAAGCPFGRLQRQDRNRLAAAEADLKDAAATERLFDRRLLQIAFPPQTEQAAHVLYRVNQARAALTTAAAASTSVRQLDAYQRRLNAANRPVEEAVKVIRRQLGLPSPSTS